jgi:hypothetical protein
MQKREGRSSGHRRDDSGVGFTPSSATRSGAGTGGINGAPNNVDGRHAPVNGSRLPPASGSGGGSNGYAMNLPPSSFRVGKSPRTRSSSPSTGSLKTSPLPIDNENIFTFPPRNEAGVVLAEPKVRCLRPAASQPALNGWKTESMAARPPYSSMAIAAETGVQDDQYPPLLHHDQDNVERTEYNPPCYRARPRTASLKSVHHYQKGLRETGWLKSSTTHNVKGKENGPRSSALSGGFYRRKGLGKSQSISSFINSPSATTSITWIGQHLASRFSSEQAVESKGGLDVTVGSETTSTNVVSTPSTPASTASSGSEPVAWMDPSDGLVFWQNSGRQRGVLPHHNRLCSLGENSDVDKTPMAKRILQVDTRLAQAGFKQARSKRDSLDSRASPRGGDMPLFYIPPGHAREVSQGQAHVSSSLCRQ